jgi:membrane-associated phospholipid phosphatase
MTKFLVFLLLLPITAFSQNADIEVLRTINSSKTLSADGFFRFLSDSRLAVAAGVPLTMGATALITENNPLLRNAIEIAAASAINLGATYAVKYAVNRERPFVTYPDISPKTNDEDPSFPSGHTSVAFTTATSISLIYPKWYVIVPSFLWAGAVGYSRMYLGVHYPSDVLAGALLGSGSAWLTHQVSQQLQVPKKHGKFE